MNNGRPIERSLMHRSTRILIATGAAAWWTLSGVAPGESLGLVRAASAVVPSGHGGWSSSGVEQDGEVTVEATARGSSASEARKEAIVAALRKIVGEYVEADVEIADDEVVKNELLSFSNAGGVKSEQVGEAKLLGDEVEVTMRVTVKPKPLVARVKGAAKAGAKLDGAALAAEIAAAKDDFEAKKRVLDKAFADLPDGFMTIRIVDSEGKDTKGIDRKLVKVDRARGSATITIPIVLGFDMAVWMNNVYPALDQVLKAAADRVIHEDLVLTHDSESWSNGVFKYTKTAVKALKGYESMRGTKTTGDSARQEGNVLIGLERESLGRGRQLNFNVYEVEADLLPFLSRSERQGSMGLPRFDGFKPRRLRVRLMDAVGNVVEGSDALLSELGAFTLPHKPGGTGLQGLEKENPYIQVLTPMIGGCIGSILTEGCCCLYIGPRWINFGQQASDGVVEVQFTIPIEDLELIERIEVELIKPAATN